MKDNRTPARPQDCFCYVPDNFDPLEVLPPHLHRYSGPTYHTIDRIVTGPIRDKRIQDGYVSINAAHERGFYSDTYGYTWVMDDLLDSGAIERDGIYSQGKKSFGHRMGEAFRDQPIRQVAITDTLLIKKIAADRHRQVLALDPTCRDLYGKLRVLRIDHRTAKASLVRKANGYSPHDLAIDMIHDGRFFASRCEFGRFHSNLTNLPASLRCYLTAQGKRLVALDFVNFQPSVFAYMLQQRYAGRPMPPDASRYVDVCLSGRLYEELAGQELRDKGERRKVKQHVFQVMFGRNEYGKHTPWMARRFADLFPSVYAALLAWKAEAQDYRVVARELQRAESNFIIGRVAPVLSEQFPRKFLGTIHDSFLVTAGMEADVRAILEAEARAHFGVELRVTVEHLAPPTRST